MRAKLPSRHFQTDKLNRILNLKQSFDVALIIEENPFGRRRFR